MAGRLLPLASSRCRGGAAPRGTRQTLTHRGCPRGKLTKRACGKLAEPSGRCGVRPLRRRDPTMRSLDGYRKENRIYVIFLGRVHRRRNCKCCTGRRARRGASADGDRSTGRGPGPCRTSGSRNALLSRAYGIAVIPDVTKVAFIFGGRHGNGALVVRDKLTSPWSNPVLISLTGGSWGFQVGAQSSDIILVFTTKTGIEGIAGGKLTLGADASVGRGSGRAAGVGGDRHPVQRRDLFLREDARSVRRHCARWQRHVDRPVGECLFIRQAWRNGVGDLLGAGACPAAHGATLSRTAGTGHSHRGARIAGASGRHSSRVCRTAGGRRTPHRGGAPHLSAGTTEIGSASGSGSRVRRLPFYSGRLTPDPPISFGMSFILALPS